MDQFAAELTKKHYPELRTVLTGPLQSRKYATFDTKRKRRIIREKFELAESQMVIVFLDSHCFTMAGIRKA